MNSGAGAGTPLACWASASGACSWASSPASWACIAATAPATPTAPVPHPDRQRVHERPRHPVRARPGVHPAEQHRAEHHVITAGHRRQHPRPHQVEHRRRGHPQRPGPLPQPPRQPRVHRQPGPRDRAARPRGHPAARTARSARSHRPAAPAKYRSCSSRGTPSRAWATKSRNGSGSGSRSALARPAAPRSRPAPPPARCGPAPGDAPAAAPATGRSPGSAATCSPQQRRPAQVHPRPRRGQQRRRRVRRPPAGPAVDLGDRQPRLPPHHLHRLGQPLPGQRRPEDVMPVDHLLQRAPGTPPAGPATSNPSTTGSRYTSAPSARGQQVMEEHALLQRRQRVDVGHVRRPAVHPAPRSRPISSAVSSASGSISGVICRAPAGIRFGGTATAAGPAAAASPAGVGASNSARTGTCQPPLPQPLHQPHRQQRMPAQREEVVLGPDPRPGRAPRRTPRTGSPPRTVAGPRPAAAPRRVVRGGQRRPVQLPVRGQRQRVQHHHRAGTMYSGSRAAAYSRTAAASPPRRPRRRRRRRRGTT